MADIKHLIEIKASPETVYSLVGTPQGLSKWWAEDVFDDTTDACSLGFFNRQTIYKLRIASRTPNARVIWNSETGKEWAGTTIDFSLEPRGAGALVRFSHSKWAAETDYFTSCNTAWGELMHRIMAAAEGRTGGPLFKKSGFGY